MGAAFLQQRIRVDKVGVANQKRIGKILVEIGQRGKRLGIVRRFQIGVAEVVGNVVAQFAGSGLGPVERIDSFAIIVIERAGIADRRARQCSSIFFGMTAGVGFDSGIGGGSAVLQQLLRHGAKIGRGDKGLPHPAHARRNGLMFFLGDGRGCGLFLGWAVFGAVALDGAGLAGVAFVLVY